MLDFKNLDPKDNFYQTSLFFPMPVVMIGTIADNGETNLGPYSLLAPYYIAGKDYYAMLLECRNSSNTAQNILKRKNVLLTFSQMIKSYLKKQLEWVGQEIRQKKR